MDNRVRAIEAYIKALRTGEASATAQAATFLAKDVTLDTTGAHMWGNGHEEFKGYDDVRRMITGIGVMTQLYRGAGWSEPQADGDRLTVSANLGGGLLSSATLTFSFNSSDQITQVVQVNAPGTPAPVTDRFPDFVQGIVNSALANNRALIVAYTDDNGAPNLSFRGSTQVYSDHQLSMWVRHANGGMATTLKKNPHMTLMYRDPPATLTFQGLAHFETSEEVRNRVFDLMPEVEQAHDWGRTGAALIIDIQRLNGNTPRGGVRMERKA